MMVETLVGGFREGCNWLQYIIGDMERFEEKRLAHVSVDLLREVVAPGQPMEPGCGLSDEMRRRCRSRWWRTRMQEYKREKNGEMYCLYTVLQYYPKDLFLNAYLSVRG